MRVRTFIAALFAYALIVSAFAQSAVNLSPEQEKQARSLFKELRCVVCQNQSIDDSDADVAKDLRDIVREKLEQGWTPERIKTFLVTRYGEFVLLRPPFAWHTLLLWIAPFALLAMGLVWIIVGRLTSNRSTTARVSDDDRARAERLLSGQRADGE